MRDTMIFYRSFYEAIKELPIDTQGELYNALFSYGLDFNEPELKGISKTVWILIKPQIDANIRKYHNGKIEKTKQIVSKTEAKDKQIVSKTEANVNDNVNDNVKVNKQADALMIEKFILWFNDMKLKYKKVEGKFKTLSKTDLNNLKSLKTLGYTADDFEHAYKIMVDSIWTKENSTDTPTHFLRNDNFSKYVNTVVSNQSKVQPYG